MGAMAGRTGFCDYKRLRRSSVALVSQLTDCLQYPLGPSQYSSPTKRTSVREESGCGRRPVAVFNSNPIVHEVSSLLSVRDRPNVRDDHSFLPAVKLNRALEHAQRSRIPKSEQVQVAPSVFTRKVPNLVERLSCHCRTSSFRSLFPSLDGVDLLAEKCSTSRSTLHQDNAGQSIDGPTSSFANPFPITSSVSSANFSAGSSSRPNHRTSAASLAAARSPATRRHRKSIKT